MTMQAAIHGRLGQDPQQRQTKSDTTMATCSMVVDVTPYSSTERLSQWFGIVAFGKAAEALLRCKKGDMASVSGRVALNVWTGKDGQAHEQLQITADSVIGGRTVRPGGGRKTKAAYSPA